MFFTHRNTPVKVFPYTYHSNISAGRRYCVAADLHEFNDCSPVSCGEYDSVVEFMQSSEYRQLLSGLIDTLNFRIDSEWRSMLNKDYHHRTKYGGRKVADSTLMLSIFQRYIR